MQDPSNRPIFQLEIAEISLLIESPIVGLIDKLKHRYLVYEATNQRVDLTLYVNHDDEIPGSKYTYPKLETEGKNLRYNSTTCHGQIDIEGNRAELIVSKSKIDENIDYIIRVLIALLVFKSGGLLVHGAGIVFDHNTYIFFGHSGSGKTTVSQLSKGGGVLSDDLVVVKPSHENWKVFATPFGRMVTHQPSKSGYELTSMFRLIKDDKNYLESLPPSLAIAELMGSAPVVSDLPQYTLMVIGRCKQIIRSIPIHRLHFLPNASFWELIQ
jgi:hypothetical protein